jgi:hypothetical protein
LLVLRAVASRVRYPRTARLPTPPLAPGSGTTAHARSAAGCQIGLAFDPTSVGGAAPVAFRFTPQGKGGNWQIDDVYVDPWARR